MSVITRFRGDTKGFTITIKDGKGNVVDIDGCSLTISVSAIENPVDATEADYIMQLSGTIVDPSTNGVFQMTITADEADNVGDFFYDAEFLDSDGAKSTLDKDAWIMEQDITK